ncbi:hypothetical protein K439DRAFT_1362993 [Ramaria rubella]|nr:hypothetical protein K439DRAFT_1362993 [Ramaria rubella]
MDQPPQQWDPKQSSVHVIITLNSLAAANMAIATGLVIAGKRVQTRKLLQEPRRCLKCHQIGANHTTADCKQIHDTCGMCSTMHRTSECTIRDPKKYRCSNCKGIGHTAWDQECPAFQTYNTSFQTCYPENEYKFFPTSNDPHTWEMLDSSSTAPGLQNISLMTMNCSGFLTQQ